LGFEIVGALLTVDDIAARTAFDIVAPGAGADRVVSAPAVDIVAAASHHAG
jgi:hypothetical protein